MIPVIPELNGYVNCSEEEYINKCEELRKSRDNWRSKYENSKDKLK